MTSRRSTDAEKMRQRLQRQVEAIDKEIEEWPSWLREKPERSEKTKSKSKKRKT